VTPEILPLTGRRACLVWFTERRPADPSRAAETYTLDPPFDQPTITTLMLVAPLGLLSFEDMLRSDRAERDDWRRFLSCCRFVEGDISRDGGRVDVWQEQDALPLVEALAGEDLAEEIRPGTGPALLPVPGGRVPVTERFLEAIRENREFVGRAGERPDRDALHLWAIPQEEHLNVVLLFHDRREGWSVLLNPFRIPAGMLYGPP